MEKIDLMIEWMEQILNDDLPSPENMMTAFRYACELRELKPVGEFKRDQHGAWYEIPSGSGGKKFYRLDGVTK